MGINRNAWLTGVEPARYFKALSRIWKDLPKGMEVDLIPFEDAYEHLRNLALTEGLVLDDKNSGEEEKS